MKQTAVEFLIEQIKSKADKLPTNTKENRMAKGIYVDCLLMARQSKEMEKQQIIDACNQEECFGSSGYGIHEDITKGEEYYNVTFNKSNLNK
jgi:hypothetical protein